jgi:diguanylate cyclase (GGDEF)-like protein/PAS domain S-box-containing protein
MNRPDIVRSPKTEEPTPAGSLPFSCVAMLDHLGMAAAVLDAGLHIRHASASFARAFKQAADALVARDIATVTDDAGLHRALRQMLADGMPFRHETRPVRASGKAGRTWSAYPLDSQAIGHLPGDRHIVLALQEPPSRPASPRAGKAPAADAPTPDRFDLEMTAQHLRNTAVLESRMRLAEISATVGVEELMQATLDDAEALTASTIGFFHFVDADEDSLTLTAWSTNTLATMCSAAGKGEHYDVAKAGIWADCIRLRRPVVHNDYARDHGGRGLPPGHAPILREMTVPVLVDGKVVAAIGVGNKPTEYDGADVAAVSELAQYAIEIVTRKRAIEIAEARERETRHLFDSMASGFALYELVTDEPGTTVRSCRLLDCNPAYEAITGQDRRRILGRELAEYAPDTDPKWIERFGRIAMLGDCGYFDDFENDLNRRYRLTAYRPAPGRCAVVYDDITVLRASEASLREAAAVFENIRDGVTITDADGRIINVNRAFTEITGYRAEEAIGQTPRLLRSGRHDAAFYATMWDALRQHGFWQGEIWNKRRSGEIYPEWLTITAVSGKSGAVERYIGVFTDITRIKQAEERADFISHHDGLTGLPNRTLLGDRFAPALERALRRGHKVALLILDLDLFKNINDSLGHEFGDRLLIAIADRFKTRLRGEDTLARIGGDEFAVLMEDLTDSADAAILARGLLDALDAPFSVDGVDDVVISASIGISISPDDGGDSSTAMRNADAAVFLAKARGRKTFRFYTESLTTLAHERMSMETRLRKAIDLEQLVLHFQPLIDSKHCEIIGAEALVRWNDPEHGLISPMRFIPVAEDSGLIAPLGAWVLKAACRQMKAWLDAGRPLKTIAVNMSPRQFALQDVPALVQATLVETGLAPEYLELEITEGILMEHGEGAIAVLNTLRRIGVRLSIDDFGTGYSSLGYLKRFPIDKLKIDQSFVRDLLTDDSDAEIVATIVAMARSLKLSVLAEGVETAEQLFHLEALGCDYYQGYLFGRPVPAADFPERCAAPCSVQ